MDIEMDIEMEKNDNTYESITKLKKISDYKEFLSKCGYFIKDVPFNKSFFEDILQGKKKLLRKDEISFYKGKFPGYRELSRKNL